MPIEVVDSYYLITEDKLEEDNKLEDYLPPQTEFRTYAMADCNVANIKENDIMQFETRDISAVVELLDQVSRLFSSTFQLGHRNGVSAFGLQGCSSKVRISKQSLIDQTKAVGSRINRRRRSLALPP